MDIFGARCGVLYVVWLLFGWAVVAGFIPPHRPSASAGEIAAIFQNDTLRIRIGMLIVMFAAMIVIPFSALLAKYMARIEGGAGVLAYRMLLGGAGTMILTFWFPMPAAIAIAAFCDNSPQPVFPRWVAFAAWFLVISHVLRRAIRRERLTANKS